jgi:hypothetical protein
MASGLRADHRYVLAARRSLAEALAARPDGRAEADSLLRSLHEVERARLPEAHTDLARTLHLLGTLRLAGRDAAAAEPLLRESLAIRRRRLGADHWQVGESESALGEALVMLGRVDDGRALLVRGAAILEERRGRDDRRTREALRRLAASRTGR